MSSTNKTTNYELSQYVAADKPTYLGDYNSDMSKIDTGIHAAKSEADINTTNIGDLTNLTTEAKNTLVAAINEVDSNCDTNAGNIETNRINIATNTSAIGTLANLETTAKSNLVVSINELVEFLNINTFDSYTEADMSTDNGTLSGSNITVATNSNKSLAKIYGTIYLTPASAGRVIVSLPNTGLAPASDININNAGIFVNSTNYVIGLNMTIKTTGTIEFEIWTTFTTANQRATFIPCLYFIKDFGDVPQV